MYLIVIAWLYVTLMMSVAEATHSNGTVLGGIITFVLYGLLPLSIVIYIFGTPARRRAIHAREMAERTEAAALATPDAGGHTATAPSADAALPVRKEP